MNITLLAEFYKQSHITVPHKPISGFDPRIEDTVFVPDKFAELIINECINQAHSVAELRGANDDMITGADRAAVQIGKRFGITK